MSHSQSAEELELHFATLAVENVKVKGHPPTLATPIFASSTFQLDNIPHAARVCSGKALEGESSWLYTRLANPTTDVLARTMAKLEGGYGSLICGSGMAAITTAICATCKAGDHIVACSTVYGGTHELMTDVLPRFGIEITFVDGREISNYEKAIKSNTKVLYGETPTNPTMDLVDLEAFGALGKSKNLVTIIDNTFASPVNQKPFKYGIDIVVHSATKYIGGHSDVVAGIIVSSTKEFHDKCYKVHKLFGAILSPFDSFLLIRGIKTLDVRVQRQNENAMAIAKHLESHPKIQRVFYPGLESHPQYAIAKKQMSGFGGMIAFEVKGGVEASRKLCESVQVITLAVSLGGVESLIETAANMTHWMIPREERIAAGITDGLVRLSVGCEDVRDLIADLDQALEKV